MSPRAIAEVRAYIPRAFPSLACASARAIAEELFDDVQAVRTLDAHDVDVVARKQLGHSCAQAIGAGTRCAHGHAQAYLYAPLREEITRQANGERQRTVKAEHATCWLACPRLERAVRELERDGGIHTLATEIENGEIERGLDRAHEEAPRLRNFLIGVDAAAKAKTETRTDLIVNRSGLIGVSLDTLSETKVWKKVKCLHAQVADALVRGRSKNPVGALVLERLEESGMVISGTPTCHENCGAPRAIPTVTAT